LAKLQAKEEWHLFPDTVYMAANISSEKT